MAFDLSWLWNTLNGIIGTIQSWFNSLWTVAENIGNTGQGIFSGLVAFGSQLWDAIIKAFDTIGEWFYNAFNWIWQGLVGLGNTLGQWIGTAFQWLSSGIQWVANGIWSLGSWLYNGLVFIWNWIVNTAQAVWEAIVNFFSGIGNAIGSWWSSVVSGINTWFTNLVINIRNKIVNTIMADVSIYFGWKSIERLISASNLKDAGFSLLGLIGSPFIAYLFGNIINGLIPTPSTTPMQLIPEITPFSYSPPSLTITTPTERILPTQIPYTPSAPPVYGYTPVADESLSLGKPTYELRWDAGKDVSLDFDKPILSGGRLFEINHTFEVFESVYGNIYQAQTFTPTENHKLTSLILDIYSIGNPQGNLVIEIYNVDAEGKPTGSPLATMQRTANKIPIVPTEIEIVLPTWLDLSAGTTYAIVLKCQQGTYNNMIQWAVSNNNPYARGTRVYSNDGGATWIVNSSDDFWFDEWGF